MATGQAPDGRKVQVTLKDVAALAAWPTCRTSDTNGAGLHGDGGMDLRTAVRLTGWRTTRSKVWGGSIAFPRRASEPRRTTSGGDVSNSAGAACATNGFWCDADWLGCRDGRWRPVEPGTFPLIDGTLDRVGRLRGDGDAIVGPVLQGSIEAVMASEPWPPCRVAPLDMAPIEVSRISPAISRERTAKVITRVIVCVITAGRRHRPISAKREAFCGLEMAR